MKKFLTLTVAVLLASQVSARSSDEDSKLISQALEISEPSAGSVVPDKEPETKVENITETTQRKKTAEVDSSYYSVNKFNFLFYLMYKMKYTGDGKEVSEKEQPNLPE